MKSAEESNKGNKMTRTLYKFTDSDMCTCNNTKWVLGEWKETDGEADYLCNESWLHAYEDLYVAALMYPIHVSYKTKLRFFKAEGDGKFLSEIDGKCGVTKLRLTEEIPVPVLTSEQRVKIAIYCTLEVYQKSTFVEWANDWLSGKDRSRRSAQNVYFGYDDSAAAAYYTCNNDSCFNTANAIYYAVRVKKIDLLSIIKKVLAEDSQETY